MSTFFRLIVPVATLLLCLSIFALGRPFFFDAPVLATGVPDVGEVSPPSASGALWERDTKERFPFVAESERERGWTQQRLLEMGEPFLSCCNPGVDEAYRFTWVRSFHPTVVVRFWRKGETQYVHVLTRDLNPEEVRAIANDRLSSRPVQTLSARQWTAVRDAVDGSGFWSEAESGTENGIDGATWVLEGRRDAGYHFVERWSPESGAFREGCLTLLQVAGFSVSADDVY
jgi:hypothetical protein